MGMMTAIEQLHDRCAVYTSASAASRLLDLVGWTADADLTTAVLLEPCVGEGAIVLEGARRLVASFVRRGHELNSTMLLPRLIGFEFHPGAARSARKSLRGLLAGMGIGSNEAEDLADRWIRERDFLLERPHRATHVAANPPYVRWAKLPPALAAMYRANLPDVVTRGDISVAFLHRMLEWARDDGIVAALVSDRWLYAQYGERFVVQTKGQGWSITVADARPAQPFVRDVGAYAALVIFSREGHDKQRSKPKGDDDPRSLHGALLEKHGSLIAAGCTVRVGPALGAGKTFVMAGNEQIDVEPELVRLFVEKQDLVDGQIGTPRLRVVVPYDLQGKLIDPGDWPGFASWAAAREDVLKRRSHVRDATRYWRTIDAVPSHWSKSPKLLLPELCNRFKTTIDRTGSIPAHSLYAIWSDDWPIDVLGKVLDSGLLELTAKAEAPKLKMGWVRFYKRFLVRTPLPRWSKLTDRDRAGLLDQGERFNITFHRLFGFRPSRLPVP